MAHTLVVIRHAKSDWDVDAADRARPLAEQRYRIHFHVWTATGFIAFLMSYREMQPVFDLLHMEQNEDECLVLLQKKMSPPAPHRRQNLPG